jgi:hypothetical protein
MNEARAVEEDIWTVNFFPEFIDLRRAQHVGPACEEAFMGAKRLKLLRIQSGRPDASAFPRERKGRGTSHPLSGYRYGSRLSLQSFSHVISYAAAFQRIDNGSVQPPRNCGAYLLQGDVQGRTGSRLFSGADPSCDRLRRLGRAH